MKLTTQSDGIKEERIKRKTWIPLPLLVFTRVSDTHFFFADPDPGKNFHADPDQDPDPGGIQGGGWG